jgi:hypothetical protein
MKKFILPLLLIAAIKGSAQCNELTLKLTPSKITFFAIISTDHPDTFVYEQEDFLASQWTCGGPPCEVRSLLQVDLGQIPLGAIIDSAFLNLYADLDDSSNDRLGQPMYGTDSSDLFKIISPWNYTHVNWTDQPVVDSLNPVPLVQSTNDTESYFNLNVKSWVQTWVDSPSINYGFMLKIVTPSYYNSMIFCSPYYYNNARLPVIKICYRDTATNVNEAGPDFLYTSIYPTPLASGSWQLTVSAELVGSIIEIYDDNGRLVFQSAIKNQKSEITTALSSGVYYLRIITQNGIVVKKLVRL